MNIDLLSKLTYTSIFCDRIQEFDIITKYRIFRDMFIYILVNKTTVLIFLFDIDKFEPTRLKIIENY